MYGLFYNYNGLGESKLGLSTLLCSQWRVMARRFRKRHDFLAPGRNTPQFNKRLFHTPVTMNYAASLLQEGIFLKIHINLNPFIKCIFVNHTYTPTKCTCLETKYFNAQDDIQ
jgi:hypothetical protein